MSNASPSPNAAPGGFRNLIRGLFVKRPYADAVDLNGKTAIVTGASPSSLGFEIARILAALGATVVVTTRTRTDAAVAQIRERLPTPEARDRVFGHSLDLLNRESVAGFARWFSETHGNRLDVLVNNAGIHLDLLSQWKEPRLTDDGFEIHWRTNYLGTAQLTHLLLPLLERAGGETGDARIVNVVSHLLVKGANVDMFGATRPYGSWTAYGNSKLALTHMTTELQRRYSDNAHLQAYCLHPGSVLTKVADKGLEGVGWAGTLRTTLAPIEAFFLKSPEEGAQTPIHCATHPALEGGRYFEDCRAVDPSADAKDAEVAARLWADTEAWVNA
jgi:retinol dehydrogenase-12